MKLLSNCSAVPGPTTIRRGGFRFAKDCCLSLAVCLVATLVHSTLPALADDCIGPARGTLVIVGGGDRDGVVFRHFVKLAGGRDAKLVIVPTASSTKAEYDYFGHRSAKYAREECEMSHVTVVHTHDRMEADTEAFVQPIRDADAVWFTGGRQWRIADAYLGTLTEKEFRNVLQRGGVIGGSSAGASIQGSFLVRGDTSGSGILIGDHQRGLGYIKNSAIDQHVIPRNRQQGLIEVLTDPDGKMEPSINRHALLGIGIDEGTGIVVVGNQFNVVGKDDGVVLLYDPKTWTSEFSDSDRYMTLWNGAKYDLGKRCVLSRGTPPGAAVATPSD
ncbi:MAG: cyanophycinase [Fuerstiella sp.]|nr:cyanophycinase [Fuerstiella sp.]MCP4857997.1 cyanophycinase [Fuerstiella sp.]